MLNGHLHITLCSSLSPLFYWVGIIDFVVVSYIFWIQVVCYIFTNIFSTILQFLVMSFDEQNFLTLFSKLSFFPLSG